MRLHHLTTCLAVLASTALAAAADAPHRKGPAGELLLLTDFEEKRVADGWKTVNDNVMGGRSKGGPAFGSGILTFSGSTNTNGGGFSSIRTIPGEHDLTGMTGLLIRVKGDGRTYKAEMRTDAAMGRWGRIPFRADFETRAGQWQEILLPLESFTPTFRGQSLRNPPAFDPSKVSSFGFMIYDKKDGPFTLQVDWVKVVGAG